MIEMLLAQAAEANFLTRALESLLAAGPVALVLGTVCYYLHQQNKALMEELKADKVKMLTLAIRVTRAIEALAGLSVVRADDLNDEE